MFSSRERGRYDSSRERGRYDIDRRTHHLPLVGGRRVALDLAQTRMRSPSGHRVLRRRQRRAHQSGCDSDRCLSSSGSGGRGHRLCAHTVAQAEAVPFERRARDILWLALWLCRPSSVMLAFALGCGGVLFIHVFDFGLEVTRGEQLAAKWCSGASPSCYIGRRSAARRQRGPASGRAFFAIMAWRNRSG
jgi:hypothetical protein